MGKVKLADIARLAGVSESTVSRILSGDSSRKVREETVSNVLSVAKSLGWAESRAEAVRRLKSQIKVCIVFISDHENITYEFFQGVVNGAKREFETVAKSGENLFISQVESEGGSDLRAYDAAFIIGRGSKARIDSIISSVPVVVYAGLNSIGGIDEVICDSSAGMRDAVKMLYEAGRRRIAFIGPVNKDGILFNEHRCTGYLEGLDEIGIGRKNAIMEDCYLSPQDGYEAAARLISRAMPDAVIAANDNTAIGIMRCFAEKGIKVPDDIALTGFDNISASAFLEPSLSTFDVPKEALGRFAARILLDRVRNPRSYPIRITIPYTFIERESTGGIE